MIDCKLRKLSQRGGGKFERGAEMTSPHEKSLCTTKLKNIPISVKYAQNAR